MNSKKINIAKEIMNLNKKIKKSREFSFELQNKISKLVWSVEWTDEDLKYMKEKGWIE